MTYDLSILREAPGQITARAEVVGLTREQITAEIARNMRVAGPITTVEVRRHVGYHDLLYSGSAEGLKGKRL